MTGSAATVNRRHFIQRHAVAVVTGDIEMRAFKRKVGLYVVIEEPHVPGDRVVTRVAAILEITLVRIIFCVAGDAVAFCF